VGKFNADELAGFDDRSSTSLNNHTGEPAVDCEFVWFDDSGNPILDDSASARLDVDSDDIVQFDDATSIRDYGHTSLVVDSVNKFGFKEHSCLNNGSDSIASD